MPKPDNVEYIFIVGILGNKFEEFMKNPLPPGKSALLIQGKKCSDSSHAIHLAKGISEGTNDNGFFGYLIETDLSFLADVNCDGKPGERSTRPR
jgi:hypothetical protein